jgi:hypothetical protein
MRPGAGGDRARHRYPAGRLPRCRSWVEVHERAHQQLWDGQLRDDGLTMVLRARCALVSGRWST